jgi:hypothetical protein
MEEVCVCLLTEGKEGQKGEAGRKILRMKRGLKSGTKSESGGKGWTSLFDTRAKDQGRSIKKIKQTNKKPQKVDG